MPVSAGDFAERALEGCDRPVDVGPGRPPVGDRESDRRASVTRRPCLGYTESRLPRPLDGFGFLVPRGEGPRLLGVLWDSSVYPGRAPAGYALMRAMVGGAHDPAAIDLDDAAVLDVVRRDLRTTMQLVLEPDFVHVFRHPVGIPQYTVGHLERLAEIERRLGALPGLVLAGNAYHGVAINACVAEAGPLAEPILTHLGRKAA